MSEPSAKDLRSETVSSVLGQNPTMVKEEKDP